MTIISTPIIPENGRPMARYALQPGQAVIYVDHPGVSDDLTATPIPATIARLTPRSIMLRLSDGREVRRGRRRSGPMLFFRGWCPACELPAHTASPTAMVCCSCGVTCEGLPPAHVFPAEVGAELVGLARRYRLMAERGWTHKQAWDRVNGPIQLPPLDLPPFTAELTADQFFALVLELRRRQSSEFEAARQQPLPPASPFDLVQQGDNDLPARAVNIPIARSADDSEPSGDDDLTRWLDKQFGGA